MESTTLLTAVEMISDINQLISLNKGLMADNPYDAVGHAKWKGRINSLLDTRITLMNIRDKGDVTIPS